MKPSPPSLRFASRIRLASAREFRALPLAEMSKGQEYAKSPWTVEDRVSGKKRGYTDRAVTCSAGGFQNGREVTLFHLVPYYADAAQFTVARKELEADILRMKKSGRPVRALLTGGQADREESRRLFGFLKDLAAEHGIPCSILWGARKPATDVHYSVDEDTWTVARSHYGRTARERLTTEDFDMVHIDAGDTLEEG